MINHSGPDRRIKPRIQERFPVTVRGVDTSGHPFRTETELENLSTGGVYLRVANAVENGARLSIVVLFTNTPGEKSSSAQMAADGVVLRSEPQLDGSCGLGVVFKEHRFL
jgi:PilZ domain-containing protein